MSFDILKPGSMVKIGPNADLAAMILQVRIQEQDHVDYQVVWWNGKERKTEWITGLELTSRGWEDKQAIGFINEE